jgi:hypothetical protein
MPIVDQTPPETEEPDLTSLTDDELTVRLDRLSTQCYRREGDLETARRDFWAARAELARRRP